MPRSTLFSLFVTVLLVLRGFAAEPLTKLEGCTFVPADWADGDSFLIRTDDGKEHTLRLYGADCFEWHVTDETGARRLREQRRYFGISEIGASPQASIELAKGFGKTAAGRVAVLLKSPFTVHTVYADAGGDGRYKRIYGFATLADGRELSSVLVEEGLARAVGVYYGTPDGKTGAESGGAMRDFELQAAKRGAGIWAKTNWEKLPEERRQRRQEVTELKMASGKETLPKDFLLDPNTAARDELMRLPGIGEMMANRMIEGRPYEKLEDLLEVPGIGPKTLEKLTPYLAIGAKSK